MRHTHVCKLCTQVNCISSISIIGESDRAAEYAETAVLFLSTRALRRGEKDRVAVQKKLMTLVELV